MSTERWVAIRILLFVISLIVVAGYLNILFNDWNNDFYNAIQNNQPDIYFYQLVVFSVLAGFYILAAVYRKYYLQMLEIRWRRWLTVYLLNEWLEFQTFYRLQFQSGVTDNPDQRIAEDVKMFVALTLRLGSELLGVVITLMSFVVILWSLSGSINVPLSFLPSSWGIDSLAIPGYLVWVALIYSVVGNVLAHRIGRVLIAIRYNQQRYDADFRFSLVRLRENAESVVLSAGEEVERHGLLRRLDVVVANWRQIMGYEKRLNWFSDSFAQIAVIFPYLVAAPRFFSGKIQLGGLMQIASAFGQVQGAMSWLVDVYPLFSEWRATVERLIEFRRGMVLARRVAAVSGVRHRQGDDEAFCAEGVLLRLPEQQESFLAVDLRIEAGESTLISGPSGSGKTTFFRAVAGVWPFGEGVFWLPFAGRLMFLPQKPYMPIGRLRAAIVYPGVGGAFSDGEICQVLEECGLAALCGILDEESHWANRLSPGEQQRIAVARVLLHKPDWAFLDEATSACDLETEQRLYQALRQRASGTTLISISHREEVALFHRRHFVVENQRLVERR
ncbi:vitamin B12/bleomycin/antimicrobial peptide transport system ATP-binding/permease protein [Azospirillaceae bacterium]